MSGSDGRYPFAIDNCLTNSPQQDMVGCVDLNTKNWMFDSKAGEVVLLNAPMMARTDPRHLLSAGLCHFVGTDAFGQIWMLAREMKIYAWVEERDVLPFLAYNLLGVLAFCCSKVGAACVESCAWGVGYNLYNKFLEYFEALN